MNEPNLRQQMVIRKAKKSSWQIITKSIVSFLIIWALWALTAYLIVDDHHALFMRPLVDRWTLWDILRAAVAVVAVQLFILQLWRLYIRSRMKKYRRQQAAANAQKENKKNGINAQI